MTTYAQIINGFAVDVVITPPEMAERFHPEWLARQAFIAVPDGTKNGAIRNQDGSFTNDQTKEAHAPVVLTNQERIEAKLDAIAATLGIDVQAAIGNALNSKQSG